MIAGAIFDVVVDIRRGSPNSGDGSACDLSAEDFRQLYVPAGFAHGFCVLSDTADVEYKCSDYYDPAGEAGVPWDDPAMGISGPISAPILSRRDIAPPAFEPDRQIDSEVSRGIPAPGGLCHAHQFARLIVSP